MDELMVEHVLRAVEQVPPGRVTSYGAIAELMGGTARQVGSVMRCYGSNVTWWRVVNASGDVPVHLRGAARRHWSIEGIEWKPNRLGCRIEDYRVDPWEWGRRYADAVRELSAYERASSQRSS